MQTARQPEICFPPQAVIEEFEIPEEVQDTTPKQEVKEDVKEDDKPAPITQLARLFIFNSLHDVIASAKIVGYCYAGSNSLYKDESENVYLLLVKGSSNFPKDFNRVCNILSEYGSPRKCQPASLSYLAEHYTCIIPSAALQKLAGIK